MVCENQINENEKIKCNDCDEEHFIHKECVEKCKEKLNLINKD